MMSGIVMDNGTNLSKIGFNEDDYPSFKFATSNMKHENSVENAPTQSSIVKKGGIQIDFDALTLLWDRSFHSLGVDPTEHPIFLSEAPLLPKRNRQYKAEILFESFGVKSLYISPEEVLPLYACGEVSGTVIEIGAGHCHVASIFDSHIIPSSLARYDLSGNELTQYLADLLELKYGFIFKSSFHNIQNTIKESVCYVAQDYHEELTLATASSVLEESFTLPDGENIKTNEERFIVPELMFQPSLSHRDIPAIHQMIQRSIMSSDIDTRRYLCQHIILSGGSTMFPGLDSRLLKEVRNLFPAGIDINVMASEDRNIAVWVGGAVLSSLSSFQNSWITKSIYDEKGSSAFG